MKPVSALAASLFLLSAVALSAQDPPQPDSHEKTYSLLPGRVLDLRNRTFHAVEIRSEYPVQIVAGNCRSESTAQWHCKFSDPADLFVRDLRPPTTDPNVRANSVVVTESEESAPDGTLLAPVAPPSTQTPEDAGPPVAAPAAIGKTRTRSYQLQQGHSLSFTNNQFTDFEIHSSGPISVSIGDCYSAFTFKIECHGEIADIQIKDLRAPQQTGPNLVVISATKF